MKRVRVITLLLLASMFVLSTTKAGAEESKIIKILAIGNSFSQDAVEQYLHQLAEAEGYQTIIGNMYIGGCTLETHYKNMQNNNASYAYRKIGTNGIKVETNNVKLETALQDEEWDYVSLQQASGSSGIYSTYTPYIQALTDYIKNLAPTATLMWHQTWAYSQNSSHSEFSKYDKDQMTMYNAIVNASRQAMNDYDFQILIPSGTAVQNARTTFIGDNMNRDGYHLNVYYGRYTAACTWFETIFKKSVVGNTYVPDGVDSDQARAAQNAAHAAVVKPDEVTDLSYITETLSEEVVYVRPDDTTNGNGSSWDNALPFTTFCNTLSSYSKGTTFKFAGGIYVPSASISIADSYTFIGGYDPASTGTSDDVPSYPSATPTVFSADKNGNNIADAGDLAIILNISSQNKFPVVIRGINFTGAYAASGAADKSYGAVYANNCKNLTLYNCKLHDNSSMTQGGIALRSFASITHLTDCEIINNQSVSHGPAIRISSDNTKGISSTTLERCLITNNTITNNVGSAICVQHSNELFIINSTIANNTAGYGGAVYVNGKGTYSNALYVIGSTIANNNSTSKNVQLQMATGANLHIMNSIIAGTTYDDTSAANSAIAIANAAADSKASFTVMESAGYNILGPVKASNSANITWHETDNVGVGNLCTELFDSNTLNNGDLSPKNTIQPGIGLSDINSVITNWGITTDADLTVDQHNNPRSAQTTPGATAVKTSGTTSNVNAVYNILSVNENTIYDLNGRRLFDKSQTFNHNFQLSKGIYIHNRKKIIVK